MNISCDIIKYKSLWITVIPISEPFGHQSIPQVYILYNHSPKKEKQQKERKKTAERKLSLKTE